MIKKTGRYNYAKIAKINVCGVKSKMVNYVVFCVSKYFTVNYVL